MSRSARATAIAVLIMVVGLANAATACTGDDADDASTAGDELAATDTAPTTTSARNTPFCAGMIDLSERLESADESDDTAVMIRSTYADLDDVVPAEIRSDFEAIRRTLVDQSVGSTITSEPIPTAVATDTVATSDSSAASDVTAANGDGEAASIPDTPEERVADYVDRICRSTANNPGPPETQPP